MGRKLLATAKANPGMVIDGSKLGAPKAVVPSKPAGIVTPTAAPGSIKPDFPKTATIMTLPNTSSGLLSATAGADRTLATLPGSANANPFIDRIPDIPGTQIDDNVKAWIKKHPVLAVSLFGVAAVAAVIGVVAANRSSKKKSSNSKKRKTTKRKTAKRKTTRKSRPRSSKKRTRKSGYGSAKAYNRKGGKKVYKTKKGQPYILLASGKARFIKK